MSLVFRTNEPVTQLKTVYAGLRGKDKNAFGRNRNVPRTRLQCTLYNAVAGRKYRNDRFRASVTPDRVISSGKHIRDWTQSDIAPTTYIHSERFSSIPRKISDRVTLSANRNYSTEMLVILFISIFSFIYIKYMNIWKWFKK